MTDSGLDQQLHPEEPRIDSLSLTVDLIPQGQRWWPPHTKPKQHLLGLHVSKIGRQGYPPHCNFDVITVHGIHDDYKTAWKEDNGSSWLNDLFRHIYFREIDYEYNINKEARIYEPGGIELEAEALITAYSEHRGRLKESDKCGSVIWICHDLGGTIVKEALRLSLSNRRQYGEIALLTKAIIFLGTPHWFQSIQDAENQIRSLVLLAEPNIRTELLDKVNTLALQVIKVNENFLETKLLDLVIVANIYVQNWRQSMTQRRLGGDKTTPNGKDEDELPDPITPFWQHCHIIGQAFESSGRHRLDNINHADLVHGDGQDAWVKSLANYLWKYLNQHDYEHEIRQFQAKLLSLVPPTLSLDTPFDPLQPIHPVIGWIMEREAYARFNNIAREFRILHLHASQGSLFDIRQVSRLFYLQTNDNPRIVTVYFEFDQWDARYNNISSMMIYIINIIISHLWNKSLNDRLLPEVKFVRDMRSWSLEDVYHLYHIFLLHASENIRLTIFLSCLDQCPDDQVKWFMSRTWQKSYTERDYRLIISTSTSRGHPSWEYINIDDYPSMSILKESNTEELNSKLAELLAKCPKYKQFEQQLKTLLGECNTAPYLGEIILHWLGNSPWIIETKIASTISDLSPVTASNTVFVFISSLDSEQRVKAEKIFNWIKHAVEPWTLESLSEALAVDELQSVGPQLAEINAQDLLTEMQKFFGGIICIKNRNVKFSHESFYLVPEIGLKGSAEDRASHVHCTLTKVCLRWLQLQSAHKTLDECYPEILDDDESNSVSDGVVIYRPRISMAEYAVQFWPYHYRASGIYKPNRLANNLFANKEAKKRWVEAFRLLSNPFNRLMGSYSSELPLIAMLGLDDLIDENLKANIEQQQPCLNTICWSAISEAAREGHSAIVDKLLQRVTFDEEELQNSLLLGASQDNPDIVKALFKKIPDLKTFPWSSKLFRRAVSLGLDDILKSMRQYGYSNFSCKRSSHQLDSIDIAITRNRVSSAEIALESNPGIEVNFKDQDLVSTAVRMGDPRMIEILLNADKRKYARMGWDSFSMSDVVKNPHPHLARIAAYNLNHAALELLINAGCDPRTRNDDEVYISSRHPLIIAANRGAIECIRVLLDGGRYETETLKMAKDALYEAASNGYTEIVRLLLQRDPTQDVNAPYPGKGILLTQAIHRQDTELVSLLIQYGARMDVLDPKVDDMFMKTPLSLACFKEHLDMVKLLIEKGADINFTTESSHPPLFAALASPTSQVAKYLLQHENINIHVTGPGEMNALIAAARYPRIVQDLLEKRINIDHDSAYGTVLMRAAEIDAPETIRVLLNYDAKPNLEATFREDIPGSPFGGLTALQIACYRQNPNCIKVLLDAGANASFRNKKGDDALDILLPIDRWSKRAEQCIKLLLFDGNRSNADYVNQRGQTRLHFIQSMTKVSIVELLVAGKVPFDTQDQDGYTPLAVAIMAENEKVVQCLINLGADINILNPKFGSILRLAVIKERVRTVKMLVDAGSKLEAADSELEESLLYTVLNNNGGRRLKGMVQYLVDEAKVSINQQGGKFSYPLIMAAIMNETRPSIGLEVIKFLLNRKVDINATDNYGRTALHIACTTPYVDRVKALVEAGANVNTKDKLGRLPIHFAAGNPREDHFAYLLSHCKDIDINAADQDGWTLLMWAASFGAAKTITSLVEEGANIWARGRGNGDGEEWSPLKLMNFAGNHTELRDMLKPKEPVRISHEDTEEWDINFHESKPGDDKSILCDCCHQRIIGIQWKCSNSSDGFSLCFKCSAHRSDMYDSTHIFQEIMPLYREQALKTEDGEAEESDGEGA